MTADNKTSRHRISAVLILISIVAVLGIALAGEFELIDRNLAKRGVGASLALLLLLLGNQLPKLVLPLAARAENSAPVLAAERFAATVLVGAGLAALAVWIWWPAEQMMPVAGAIVLAGFGLAAANWTRVLLANGGAVRGVSNERFGSKSRLTLLMMLHALLWVAVIFLADTIWGDVVSQWLVLPFVLINGLLAVLYQRRFKRQD
ncbi:hypothetical protein [uncultured Maricaulis sp.]|uniref:hypothetical protein n=1 Tax=uncultured Maricaulis sp. TaxID=174710 RepID=UPI0030D87174|tara:strand:+ start:6176 stop:6790 length:615 start_codon:yes stop_codon:yes gene_type:complete